MEKTQLKHKSNSPYAGACIVLPTKHQKSLAIAPVFDTLLGAGVMECPIDTDQWGTFSGEVERPASDIECAKAKSMWAIQHLTKADYSLASEGSFGPHPAMPFLPGNKEILFFVDKKREFTLHVSSLTTETNYKQSRVTSLEEVESFAKDVLFPSHALIIRADIDQKPATDTIFKGIQDAEALVDAYQQAITKSPSSAVWVETDMRAHVNPTRMSVIKRLSEDLAERLLAQCPQCHTPGWGKISIETGLPCSWCDAPTHAVRNECWGCVRCDYQEAKPNPEGLAKADPGVCEFCNP